MSLGETSKTFSLMEEDPHHPTQVSILEAWFYHAINRSTKESTGDCLLSIFMPKFNIILSCVCICVCVYKPKDSQYCWQNELKYDMFIGIEKWLPKSRVLIALAEDQVPFPVSLLGNEQLPISQAARDLMHSSGLSGYLYSHIHTYT